MNADFQSYINSLKSLRVGSNGLLGGGHFVQPPTNITNLFLVSSQVLPLTAGVLAIASLQELSSGGAWRNTDLVTKAGRVIKLTVSLAQQTECHLSESLAELKCIRQQTGRVSDIASIDEILAVGATYIAVLQKATLEITLVAMKQSLLMSDYFFESNDPDRFDLARKSLVALAEKVVGLESSLKALKGS